MKYCLIKNTTDDTFMCVSGNFVTNKKYAMLFTEKNAKRLVERDSTLKIVRQASVKSLADRESYRLRDIPSEFLVKKERKPRSDKFTYQQGDLKIIKKEENETERDNKRVNEDYLFAKLNTKCMGCSKVCKQSWKAVILACPDYNKV